MPETAIPCRCNRSVGAVIAIFATLGVLAFLAQDACLDAGGRVSDAAWACELSSGASVSIWSFVSPWLVGLVALGVGLPAYLAANAIGRRLIAAYDRRHA